MTWTALMRGLLALALVQALLGVGLAISGPGDDSVSVDDPDGAPVGEIPGPPAAPDEAPGAPGDGTSPPAPAVPPPTVPRVPSDPTIPPTAAGGTQSRPLQIHSTYDQLTSEEQAWFGPGGSDNVMVEGRVDDGTYWRQSAYMSGDKICEEKSRWDPEKRSGGSGGGGCRPKSEWGLGGSGAGDAEYLGMHGYAPAEAQQIELVAKDGRRGRVGGVFRPEMGVSFWVAYINCNGPDLERIDGLDADGRVVSSYNFAEELGQIGWPSWPCRAGEG